MSARLSIGNCTSLMLCAVLALTGCGSSGGSSTPPTGPLTTAQWQQDVEFLAAEMISFIQ